MVARIKVNCSWIRSEKDNKSWCLTSNRKNRLVQWHSNGFVQVPWKERKCTAEGSTVARHKRWRWTLTSVGCGWPLEMSSLCVYNKQRVKTFIRQAKRGEELIERWCSMWNHLNSDSANRQSVEWVNRSRSSQWVIITVSPDQLNLWPLTNWCETDNWTNKIRSQQAQSSSPSPTDR